MKTILAIDFDKHAAATYALNFPETKVLNRRVEDCISMLPYADIVMGGFPCQPHSVAGKRKASADERDGGPDFVAAVKRVQPRMFLGENVPGILSSESQKYIRNLLIEMVDAGYAVEVKLLDAVNYGVPQFRSRVWFWGIRADLYAAGMRHSWPKPTHCWPPQEPGLFGAHALAAGITVGQALHIWYPGCGWDAEAVSFSVRTPRSKGSIRRDHPVGEPCPTLDARGALGGGSCKMLVANPAYDHGLADPAAPCPTIKAGANVDASGHQVGGCPPAILVGHGNIGDRPFHVDEPMPSLRGAVPGCSDAIVPYRWSAAMREKHPPASLASPASTVQAKWFKGGAEGLLALPEVIAAPSPTVSAGSHAGGPEPIPHRIRESFYRRLTPAECMRLQSAPDSFRWPEKISKTAMYRIAGNGQSSLMVWHLGQAMKLVDPESETCISLFCGGGLGDCGWHGKYWRYDQMAMEVSH